MRQDDLNSRMAEWIYKRFPKPGKALFLYPFPQKLPGYSTKLTE